MPLIYDPNSGATGYQKGPLVADEFNQYLEVLKKRKEDDRLRALAAEKDDRNRQMLQEFTGYSGLYSMPPHLQAPGGPGAGTEPLVPGQPQQAPTGMPPEGGEAVPPNLAQMLAKREAEATGVPTDSAMMVPPNLAPPGGPAPAQPQEQVPITGNPPVGSQPGQPSGQPSGQPGEQPQGPQIDKQKYIEWLSKQASLGDERAQATLHKLAVADAYPEAAGAGGGVITRDLGDRIGIYDKTTGDLIREENKGGLTSQRLGDKLQYYDRWGNPIGDPVPFGVPPQQTVGHKSSVAGAEEAAKMAARGDIPMSQGQEAADKKFGAWYSENVIGGQDPVSKANNEISVLENALETDIKTGPFVGRLGISGLDPNTRAVRQEVERIIQQTLKETLGAQFTEKEGENLLARTFDPKAKVEVTKERIRRLIQLTKQRANNVDAALRYWNSNNSTLKGFEFEPLTIDEINDFVLEQDATRTDEKPASKPQGGGTPKRRKATLEDF